MTSTTRKTITVPTPFNYELFKELMFLCDHGEMQHSYCKKVQAYRDASGAQSPVLLVDTRDLCLVEGSPGMKYAALSYVWGPAPFFQAQKDNRERLGHRGALGTKGVTELPGTIRDAVHLCQGLGIPFV